jgi:hypothetical protein
MESTPICFFNGKGQEVSSRARPNGMEWWLVITPPVRPDAPISTYQQVVCTSGIMCRLSLASSHARAVSRYRVEVARGGRVGVAVPCGSGVASNSPTRSWRRSGSPTHAGAALSSRYPVASQVDARSCRYARRRPNRRPLDRIDALRGARRPPPSQCRRTVATPVRDPPCPRWHVGPAATALQKKQRKRTVPNT